MVYIVPADVAVEVAVAEVVKKTLELNHWELMVQKLPWIPMVDQS